MANDCGNDRDRASLLGLLERAAQERDAASQLLLSGGAEQASAAALHVFRGWHAVATVEARLSGESLSDLASFTLDSGSKILAPVSARSLTAWTESFAKIRHAALVEPWYSEADQIDLEDLSLQGRLLGTCMAALRRRVISSTGGGRGLRFRWRDLLVAIAVAVIAIVVVDLGGRTVRGLRLRAERERDLQQLPAHTQAELQELRDFKPRGSSWDGSGNIIIRNSLTVSLGEIRYPDTISVSLDGNDQFILRLLNGEKIVAMLSLGPSEVAGLEVYTVVVPVNARAQGFDRIIIEVDVGDGSHSVGHLLLNEQIPPVEAAETQ
jgi:hypothetical protein